MSKSQSNCKKRFNGCTRCFNRTFARSIYFYFSNFFMNLPAGSILVISPPTGNLLPSGTVDSSTSPHLAFYLCRSFCLRVPEKEAAKSVYVVPACSCLASVRDRHVYWCCRGWKLESGSDYRLPCAGDTSYVFAAAYVAALEAAAACLSRRVS